MDNVGLVHMNGRIYDPVIGRFLSADPIADGFGTAGGFNRYAYVGNNPLAFTDPTGLCSGVRIRGTCSSDQYPHQPNPTQEQPVSLFYDVEQGSWIERVETTAQRGGDESVQIAGAASQ